MIPHVSVPVQFCELGFRLVVYPSGTLSRGVWAGFWSQWGTEPYLGLVVTQSYCCLILVALPPKCMYWPTLLHTWVEHLAPCFICHWLVQNLPCVMDVDPTSDSAAKAPPYYKR